MSWEHEPGGVEGSGHHYLESGLDNILLLNGFEVRPTPYGEAVFIQDVDGLHRSIAKYLVEKPTNLTGKEFRFLRIELDLSQQAMGVVWRSIRPADSEY